MRPQDMHDAVIRNLPVKTGKTLDEWLAIVGTTGLTERAALARWLEKEHGLGPGQARVLASEALRVPLYVPPDLDEMLDAQYAGAKAALRPIAEAVIVLVRSLPDATVEARKTYVSFNVAKQFAAVGAPNRSTVAVDLKLKGVPGAGRLTELPSGRGFSGNLTHRVLLATTADVDAELSAWLRTACDSAG